MDSLQESFYTWLQALEKQGLIQEERAASIYL
jgi:DNA-binding PadR family transcriptional regulator